MADGLSRVLLIVEDDELVRITTAEMLREEGFEVLEAETAAQADTLLASASYLLVDRTLPDREGLVLARAARGLRPELAIVIASGRELVGNEFVSLLKPFTMAALLQALDRARQAAGG